MDLEAASCFLIMTIFAKGLPVLLIPEQPLIAPVRDDMIDHGGGGQLAFLPAFCAQRMPLQEGFSFLPVTCFAMALSTFVGQNLGAHKHDRVKKGIGFGIVCSCVTAELIGIISYFFAPQLIAFFNNAPEVVDFGARHMRTICLFNGLLAFSHCVAGIMRGAGKPTVPMVTMLVCWCLIRVTYITVAVRFVNELTTVSFAYPLTWTLSSIVFLIYLIKGNWIHTFDKLEAKKA